MHRGKKLLLFLALSSEDGSDVNDHKGIYRNVERRRKTGRVEVQTNTPAIWYNAIVGVVDSPIAPVMPGGVSDALGKSKGWKWNTWRTDNNLALDLRLVA
jgi:hypothetical protein